MNQSIQFPDREQWLEDQKYVLFPIMVNGMLFDCQITEQELKVRFGDNSTARCLFKQHRWEIEEEFEEWAKLYEVSTLHPFYCLSMAE